MRILLAIHNTYSDNTSGAARSVRGMMAWLRAAGHECAVFSTNRFDDAPPTNFSDHLASLGITAQGYPPPPAFEKYLRAQGRAARARPLLSYVLDEVPVVVLQTRHNDPRRPNREEYEQFIFHVDDVLRRLRPNLVITYGAHGVLQEAMRHAQGSGATTLFQLHNLGYETKEIFRFADHALTPSGYLNHHYADAIDQTSAVLPPVLHYDDVIAESHMPEYVTFVKPIAAKGVYFFLRLADMLGAARPDIPVQIIQSTADDRIIRDCTDVELAKYPQISIEPATPRPSTFFARTKILLVPSVFPEPFGTVAAEAMLNGVPPLVSDRGGLPDTVGLKELVLPLPDWLTPETTRIPDEAAVTPWFNKICQLWDDASAYAAISAKVKKTAARLYEEASLRKRYLDYIESLNPETPVNDRIDAQIPVKGETAPIWKKRLRGKARSAKNARVLALLRGFEKSQWRDPEDIEAEQFKHLTKLLTHAQRSVAHYSETTGSVKARDTKSLRAGRWRDVPVLKRDTVNSLGEALLSRSIPKAHGSLKPIYTSGTTGRPVRVVRTDHALNYWDAFTARDHIWHNRSIEGTLAVMRSSEKDFALYPEGAHHFAWGWKDGVFKTGRCVSLNVNTPIPDIAEWITRRKPDHILSMPNIIKRLAPYCIENGITFPDLKEIHVIGEMCGELMRQHCREAWNVPLHANYSGREVGYMALQCPVHDHYHVQSEGVYLEILNDDDQPCQPGEIGRVIVTPLHNYAMPLIRYEIGDYAELGGPCDCGRGLPVINRILGREQDILVLPTGEQRWTLLGSPDIRDFMEMAPIVQYQFAHVGADHIEIRLATKRELTAQEEGNIAEWARKKLGYPFKIDFAYFNELPLTASGKFKDFVVEIPPVAP